LSQIARRQCFLCHNLLFFVIQYEKLSFPYLIVAPLAAERHHSALQVAPLATERLVPVLQVAPLAAERLVPALQVAPLAAERHVPILQVAPLAAERLVPVLLVAPLTAERHVPYRKLRDATDSNQRVSRFCEPLPTAVIPIQAEAASLVEGSCVPSVARPEVERDIPFIFALDFVFLHKRNRPFCVIASRTPLPEHQVASKSPFSPLPEPPALL